MSQVSTQTKPATAVKSQSQQLNEVLEKGVDFVPFGESAPITLSISIVRAQFAKPTRKGSIAPADQVVRFMMMCKARQLNPYVGDAYIVGYDGDNGPEFSLITAHQALLKRAEVHAEFDGMESGVIVRNKDGELVERVGYFFLVDEILLGGWAKVFFKNRKHATVRRLKFATFDKKRSLWKSNPEGMITKCAEADALRSSFPTQLGGLYIEGEMPGTMTAVQNGAGAFAVPIEPHELPAPAQTKADRVADKLAGPSAGELTLGEDHPLHGLEVALAGCKIKPEAAELKKQATGESCDPDLYDETVRLCDAVISRLPMTAPKGKQQGSLV